MVCTGCNKPHKQVCVKSITTKNMTSERIKEILSSSTLNLLLEVQKDIKSDTSYLHFSTVEGASVFYNTYSKKGLSINNMHFTIHPTQLRDGSLTSYSFQKISFKNQSTFSSSNAETSNNTNMLIPSTQTNVDITNTATTIIPTNAATTPIPSLPTPTNADISNAATIFIPSLEANADITGDITTSSSEWRLNTKRAIDEISKEIKQLKKARKHLKKALKEH